MSLPPRRTPESPPARHTPNPALSAKAVRRLPGRALTGLLSLLLSAALLGTPPHPADADVVPALSTTTDAAVAKMLQDLTTQSTDADPRYLADNVWHDGTPECFRCTLGPAVLAAQQALVAGVLDKTSLKASEATFDRGIKDHQRADGAYIPAAPGEGGPDIQTVLFANELAQTYLMLGVHLDYAHRARWAASITRSADWLIRNNNLTYYTNGNLNLALTMNMDLAYHITGLTRFKDAAVRSLGFTLAPPQTRWKGFGLHYVTTPTAADGSDGAGYLGESGGAAPGYDPAYTMVQANIAALWYLLTGNKYALRLTNLFYNQELSRVRKSDWTIDVGGGTRRITAGVRYRFSTPALPVLALLGGRTDLQPDVGPQLGFVLGDYQAATAYPQASLSYGYGSVLAPTYRALVSTPGW